MPQKCHGAERSGIMHVVQDEEAEDSDEDEAKPPPEHLAGARFRAKAEDLNEGETLIMTLADRSILDEQGQLHEDKDELENVLTVRAPHAARWARWPVASWMCLLRSG